VPPTTCTIREPTEAELPVLIDIEVDAGRLFRSAGMPEVADDDPGSVAELLGYQRAGRAWVACAAEPAGPDMPDMPAGGLVGYLIAEPVDGCAHLEQVSVRSVAAGRGIGRLLIEHLAGWAARRGLPAITLTTFRDVPWNGPYYRRLGFRELDRDEETAGLRAIRAREAAHGLDRWPRCCMRRDLPPAPGQPGEPGAI
jgi:GNAT superfamily N-acetyltransferase